ncbi:hypothetical protein QBC34DRAFT_484100 [Podospora aff. communis PSN243]|uniref:NACHT domain-containing protein n=1 Tax=Podospora aff. communis PSN243 TaxID=3040156 RepID=A0AAV9GTF0_9PEZI|nr:hypothetical protein QBC34DRAFT_484100 [Podospora aff. communis PSN243]
MHEGWDVLPYNETVQNSDASGETTGLFTLHDPATPGQAVIDLIVIHGLGGHRMTTWQHTQTGAYWPQNFIPGDFENARVMVYGYNSKVAFSKSTAGVEEFARDLLERLIAVRQDRPTSRPIIFICHSMGGLVVKKSRLWLLRRGDNHASEQIVNKNSAVLQLPNEVAASMPDTNHRTICQFSHKNCNNYTLLVAALRDLILKAQEKRAGRQHCQMTLKTVGIGLSSSGGLQSQYQSYKASIKPALRGTWQWILEEPTYLSWVEDTSSCQIWVSGDPGCGKTTLASLVVGNISEDIVSGDQGSILLYFFFDGTVAPRGDTALFALIHQLLKAYPSLTRVVDQQLKSINSQFGLNLHHLCDIFESLVHSRETKFRRIFCILDAVDECESTSTAKVVDFLSNLQVPDGYAFKLLITARHTSLASDVLRDINPQYRIDLADHSLAMANDISAFIRDRCIKVQNRTRCSDAVRQAIEKRLMARSDNTFLWVCLVVELLETATDATPHSFDSILRSRPTAFGSVLSILATSRRTLSLEEVEIALAVRPQDDFVWQVQQRRQFDISRRLHAVCGPLIRITNGCVSFIHQTAAEFLIRPPGIPTPLPGEPLRYRGCLDEVGANRLLGEMCITYLTLHDKDQTLHWGQHCRLGKLSDPHHTSNHSDKTPDDKIQSKITSLCDPSNSNFRAWFQLYWDTISTVPEFPNRLTPLIIASHFGLLGTMDHLLRQCTSASEATRLVRHADSEGWTSLHWAVWNGHEIDVGKDAVALLLQYAGEEKASDASTNTTDLPDNRGLTALHWAAADGQVGAMRLLLEAGATVDVFDKEGMTPLALAVENEFGDAVELLVEGYDADVNAAGEERPGESSPEQDQESDHDILRDLPQL